MYLNLYHQPMHQPCTKHVPTHVHQLCSTKPVTTTYLINLINQIRSTHQDQSPRQISTICIISPRCASTKTTYKHQQDVPQSRCASKSIPSHISHIIHKPCANNTSQMSPTRLPTNASNNVPSMYQSYTNNLYQESPQ
jgi:hypothetical protein